MYLINKIVTTTLIDKQNPCHSVKKPCACIKQNTWLLYKGTQNLFSETGYSETILLKKRLESSVL